MVETFTGDGDMDVLSANSLDDAIVWYESPTWTQHVISDRVRWATSVFALDFDSDADVDVIASAYDSGEVLLFLNEGDGESFEPAKRRAKERERERERERAVALYT